MTRWWFQNASKYFLCSSLPGEMIIFPVLLSLFTMFYTSQVVVWDFFHQQHHELPNLDLLFLLGCYFLNPDGESWFIA